MGTVARFGTPRALYRPLCRPGRSAACRPPRLFRVDHRDGDGVRAIAAVADVAPHHASLEPYVSALLREGTDGELLLVDAETGAIVVRRKVAPFRSKAGDRFRPLGDRVLVGFRHGGQETATSAASTILLSPADGDPRIGSGEA
jgi:hypothetical protein